MGRSFLTEEQARDADYAFQSELDTVSGTLNTKIDTTSGTLQYQHDQHVVDTDIHFPWQDVEDAISTISGTLGITLQMEWKFNTNTAATNPGDKKFKFDNSTLASVTNIYISDKTSGNVDVSNILGMLKSGNRIYIQQENDSLKAGLFTLTSAPTDNTGWWTLPVSVDDSGILMDNNKDCAFVFLMGTGITSVNWGDIGGTLSNQTDLQTEIDDIYTTVDTTSGTLQTEITNHTNISTIHFPWSDVTDELTTISGAFDDKFLWQDGSTLLIGDWNFGSPSISGTGFITSQTWLSVIRSWGGYSEGTLDFSSASGAMRLYNKNSSGTVQMVENAMYPQYIFGSDAAGTVATYMDCDNHGEMRFNTLHTGAVVIGVGGVEPTAAGVSSVGQIDTPFGDVFTRRLTCSGLPTDDNITLLKSTSSTNWTINAGRAGFYDNWLLFKYENEPSNYTFAISQNGAFRGKDGSGGAPTYTFDNASNYGMSYDSGANESLILSTEGFARLRIEDDGTLSVVGTANYEDLVLNDDDIPNKKYLDDEIDAHSVWYTINGDSGSTTPDVSQDTLTFAGSGNVLTSVSGDTVTISGTTLDTADVFEAYDNTGGQTFTNTAVTLNLDTERTNTNTSIFSLSDDVLTINATDAFIFVYRMTAGITVGTRKQGIVYLEQNSGSWVEVDGSRASGYARTGTEYGTAAGFCAVSVTSGDTFRLRVTGVDTDTNTTQADKSGLMVYRIRGPAGIDGQDGASGPPGSGSTINIYDDGTPVIGSPFEILNFEDGVTASESATISGAVDISISSVFGTEYDYVEDLTESSTTSATFQQKLRMTTSNLPVGTYRIGFYLETWQSNAADAVEWQVELNDTTVIATAIQEPDDLTDSFSYGGFSNESLSGVNTIDIDYRQQRGSTAYIRRTRLELWRVS